MKRIEFENSIGKVVLNKNRMSYSLTHLSGIYALLEVKATTSITYGFEVWKLRIKDSSSYQPNHLRFPSNNDFGKFGWFYSTREQAEYKFKELVRDDR